MKSNFRRPPFIPPYQTHLAGNDGQTNIAFLPLASIAAAAAAFVNRVNSDRPSDLQIEESKIEAVASAASAMIMPRKVQEILHHTCRHISLTGCPAAAGHEEAAEFPDTGAGACSCSPDKTK